MKKQTQKPTFPAGDVQIPNWGAVHLSGPTTALVLSDLHIPYHDLRSLTIALEAGKQAGANLVLLNGDTADFYQLSKFCKDPRARHWVEEIKLQRAFLEYLRGQFPKARLIWKMGNHDERYETFLMQNCAELIGLDEFEIQNVLHMPRHGVELVKDKRPIRLGDLNVVHGHEYRFAISNPVNPARGLFLRAKAYALCGHFHQSSAHSEGNIEGGSIATWSTGCLCDLHPAYMPLNNWIHGFALVEVYSSNKFTVKNRVIRNGRIY